MSKPKLILILGPTASGKSALGVELARTFKGEIISADSRQVYRGMNIGTGKITKKEMRGIPHYLLDVASPKKTFTVAQYQKFGEAAIKKILSKGKLPIIVGGTGFYIDALLYNYALPNVKANPKLRRALEKRSVEELFAKLKLLDPRRAETIDRHNKVRLVRALEIVMQTGKPVPRFALRQAQGKNSSYEFLKIGIRLPDTELKLRIHARLLARLRHGMIAEVKKLRKQDVSWKRLDDFGLEYRWVSRYLRGVISKKEMTETLEREIWRYAKRQMTWFTQHHFFLKSGAGFRRDKKIHWISRPAAAAQLVRKFLSAV